MESPRDFSERLRPVEKIWVNEIMWYHLEGNNVFIHLVPAADHPQVERSLGVMRQALGQVAHNMQTEPALLDKNFVIAASSIVKRNSTIFEQLGFTAFTHETDAENVAEMTSLGIAGMKTGITKPDEAMAAISREDLIKKYGSQNSS